MNIKVLQPPYPFKVEDTDSTIEFIISELGKCTEADDLILLPECCNAPAVCHDKNLLKKQVGEYSDRLIEAVKNTAIRCNSIVGINLYWEPNSEKYRNTTLLFDQSGTIVAKYEKQHLPASEVGNQTIDHSYLYSVNPPVCVEIDGIRFSFLTCFDIYYTEYINRLSDERPDIILISSLQRTEREDVLEMQAKNCAYLCNSYVVRSSYYMGEDSKVGGCSMIVGPDGTLLKNFHQSVGSMEYKIDDPHFKYQRYNGFGQPKVSNIFYQNNYRTPWSYRACGSGVRTNDKETSYPRLCAHRGFVTAAPENTIPSIAIAIALGATEVEIDARPTADGVLVISHDPHVNRLTDAEGIIQEMTCNELMELNPGKKFANYFDGVKYATLEEVFKLFPRRTIFNLHVKPLEGVEDYKPIIRKILDLAEKYDCKEHFYFASEEEKILEAALELAPEIDRCALCPENFEITPEILLKKAIDYKCKKLQALRKYATLSLIKKAHEKGIICNLFDSENVEDAKEWLELGVDTILTDNYLVLKRGLGID